MSKFKVGDKVKVRKDLEADKYYSGLRFSPKMEVYKGQIITIEYIDYFRPISYVVNGWHWNDEMLEPVETTKEDEKLEMINSPLHYNSCGEYETIKKMELLFGKDAVLTWARLTAFKYRDRLEFKENKEQDTAKMDWYLRYVEENE